MILSPMRVIQVELDVLFWVLLLIRSHRVGGLEELIRFW